jgi:hypothetical protein
MDNPAPPPEPPKSWHPGRVGTPASPLIMAMALRQMREAQEVKATAELK